MHISPLAGKLPPKNLLVDVPALIQAYYTEKPDPAVVEQRIQFGTSGHRGSSLSRTFNEAHILAICQAICDYRAEQKYTGPLFLGIDTHALSGPAFETALEVFAANGVQVRISKDEPYTPTPVISHAILKHNKGRKMDFADGVVITPSHNPPSEGGFKYNPPNGGPADEKVTGAIQKMANTYLEQKLNGIKRIPFEQALKAKTTEPFDFVSHYIDDLKHVVDLSLISSSKLPFAVDPLGGAGVHYWKRIADQYKLNLSVVSEEVDPTFQFMTVDWDGQIRMDPSSEYAMQRLIRLQSSYAVACACDTDHDRHGVVARSSGLMQPNHFLSVCIHYLFQNRPNWSAKAAVGKTTVSSSMIDRVSKALGRSVYEVPVGFKWFVDGLFSGALGFVGEESAGATFLRFDGDVWTTDKDGIVPALLSAEMTAKTGKDPGELYADLTKHFGNPIYKRVEAHANREQKALLKNLSPKEISTSTLAGEPITAILTHAPGDGASLGGIKVTTENGWFAARPSGTEEIYKIYGESFRGEAHLKSILQEAQEIVDAALKGHSQTHI